MNLAQAIDPVTYSIRKDLCPGTPSLRVAAATCDWWQESMPQDKKATRTLPAPGTDSRRIYDVIAKSKGIRQAAIAKKLGLTVEQVRGQIQTLSRRYHCVEGFGKVGNVGYVWKVSGGEKETP